MHFNYLRSSLIHLALIGLILGSTSDSLDTDFLFKGNDSLVTSSSTANYRLKPNELFMDFDGDGIPDDVDEDDDNDGISDFEEIGGVQIDPLNCNGSTLNFINFVEETGDGDELFELNEVFRFTDVNPKDATDALVTITEMSDGTIVNQIDDPDEGFIGAFQPNITFAGIGKPRITYNIRFVDAGTNVARMIESFGGIINDVDSSDVVKESYIVYNPSILALNNPTSIEIVDLGSGAFEFAADGLVNQPSIGTNPLYQAFWQINNVESVDFTFQLVKTTATAFARQYSLVFDECSISGFNDADINFQLENAPDTDGDGIKDYQDVDSDNDGIYDAVEAGHGQPIDEDGRIIGPVGEDGMADALQEPGEEDSGRFRFSENDTDDNFTPDRLELDSDKDGCFDTTEAGFIDALQGSTPDGYLGSIFPVAINMFGAVTSGEMDQGYTAPRDLYTNGTPDYQEIGPDGDLNNVPDGCQDIDGDGIVDLDDLDDDDDGILDIVEQQGIFPLADEDNDGIFDHADIDFSGFIDTNSDGISDQFDIDLDSIINQYDLDSDGDGIPDNIEAQVTNSYIPPAAIFDEEGVDTNYPGGLNPVNTDDDAFPDFLDIDSDNDTLTDTFEIDIQLSQNDLDKDGLDDTTDLTNGYTDVNGNIDDPTTLPDNQSPGADVDYRDSNTLPVAVNDVLEINQNSSAGFDNQIDAALNDVIGLDGGDANNYEITSQPSNGTVTEISDGVFEYVPNRNFFGSDVFQYSLTDSNGDADTALVNIVINVRDFDGDGVPDADDLDDDNDGIPDAIEEDGDPNRDTDMDGDIDSIDLDADGDGILDVIESGSGAEDPDNDGVLDGPYGTDGIPDTVQSQPDAQKINYELQDSDGDGIPDFQDIDDDDDHVLTEVEDVNGDGNPLNDDSDADGILDYLDLDDDGDNINTIDEDVNMDGDPTNDDTDSDGLPNYLDIDDDGDGILTIDEDINGDGDPTNDDSDGDGIPDYLDTDDDGDGVPTADEDIDGDGDPTNDDTDGDGIPNYLDEDDDGDGIPTIDELGDIDNEGIPDYLEENNSDPNAEDGIEVFNALTPNGDGENDFFIINGLDNTVANEVEVFNRWGRIVYSAKDYGKGGRFFSGESTTSTSIAKDKQLPEGVYFYVLSYETPEGEIKKRSDFIYINR